MGVARLRQGVGVQAGGGGGCSWNLGTLRTQGLEEENGWPLTSRDWMPYASLHEGRVLSVLWAARTNPAQAQSIAHGMFWE